MLQLLQPTLRRIPRPNQLMTLKAICSFKGVVALIAASSLSTLEKVRLEYVDRGSRLKGIVGFVSAGAVSLGMKG
jgi:hypothetical protein